MTSGSRTLKDAMNEALRDWVANVDDTFYIIGSAAGPHPYPAMVRDFQTVIGNETRTQILEVEGRLPDLIVACVGGGSNAIGMFHPFLDDPEVEIHGVEAAGDGVETPSHAATLTKGSPGVLHGARSYLLQDDDGQILEAHSISAGLDYPGVGPEHSWLKDQGRVKYFSATDRKRWKRSWRWGVSKGLFPALEASHAIAHVMRVAPRCEGPDHRRQAFGPRRQGCVHGRGRTGRKAMSRIAARFAELRKANRAAFVPFITAGDPDAETTLAILERLPRPGRSDRTRRAVLRSHGGRSGDPGIVAAGAAGRNDALKDPRPRAALSGGRTRQRRSC